MKTRIVGLDLETTSLNPHVGDIIEIGACVYEDGKKGDTFQFLIKPSGEIPRYVQGITGIGDDDVADAPNVEDVIDRLADFIGDSPIVGHNIWFDINFLKAKGLDLTSHTIYDTWKFATLVVDSAPSLSLEVLTRHLGILHVDTHRALDDACASVELFYELIKLLNSFPGKAMQKIIDLAQETDYVYTSLFADALTRDVKQLKQPKKQIEPNAHVRISDLNIQKIQDAAKDAVGQQNMRLVNELSEKIAQKNNSLFDCPKGIDQLHAALLASGLHEEQVHIFIPNHFAKERLFGEVLENIYHLTGEKVQPLFLGRQQEYFCLKRFDAFVENGIHSEAEMHLIAKVLLWLEGTRTGLLSELNLTHEEYMYLEGFRSDSVLCDESECLAYGGCFYHKTKKASVHADVLVRWHDTFFESDAARQALIVNADVFARSIVQHKKETVSLKKVVSKIAFLRSVLQSKKYTSLTDTQVLMDRLQELEDHIALLFGLIGMKSRNFPDINYERIVVNAAYVGFFAEQGLKASVEKSSVLFNAFVDEMIQSPLYATDTSFFDVYIQKIHDELSFLSSFFTVQVDFLQEVQLLEEGVLLIQTPLLKNMQLQYDQKPAIHLLGRNILSHVKDELDHFFDSASFSEVAIHPAFDFVTRVDVLTISDMPSDSSDAYFNDLHTLVNAAHDSSDKGVMVFMKNKGKILRYFKEFGYANKNTQKTYLYAGVSGSAAKLQGMIKYAERPIVFLTPQYFENMRVDMSAFSVVFLDRIPFQAPTPVEIKTGESDFMQSALPRAVRVFKNIYDSTLENLEDSATFVLLDEKIIHARYARYFLDAIERDSLDTLTKEEFLSKSSE